MIKDLDTKIKTGTKVKLSKQHDIKIWNIEENLGTILNLRKFGPSETMVTVCFGNKRIYISDSLIEVINDQE